MSVLLVSNDSDLAAAVESETDSIRGCEFRWIAELRELESALLDELICVAFVHVSATVDRQSLDAALQHLCSLQPRISTVVIRDAYEGEHDLWCHRMGVRECFTRPLDLRRLTYWIDTLTIRSRLENTRGSKAASPDEPIYGAASPAMRPLLKRAQRIASRDVSVLFNGETGVGKTHLARWIHQASPRSSRPFVSINCGSLPTNLIESELFGHKKGAFTGADDDRVGKFAFVQDGTLLLDEIDALTLSAQAKLLRVLDEGVFERIGCNQSLPFRGRLIAASNRSLEQLIEQDQFRADLYYRLNVVQFSVPPLRNRMEEIRSLVRHFLGELAKKHAVPVPTIHRQVWHALENYHWPGNLRELRNTLEHALADCEGTTIGLEQLPVKLREHTAAMALSAPPDSAESLPPAVAEPTRNPLAQARQMGEYRYLLGVLDMCDNNRSQAARAMGISRTALYKKLGSFGIS